MPSQANGEIILAEAESIDRFARKVILGDGEIGYDYLIIASGATHSYFGHDAWEREAPGLKTLEEALDAAAARAPLVGVDRILVSPAALARPAYLCYARCVLSSKAWVRVRKRLILTPPGGLWIRIASISSKRPIFL